MAAHPKYMPPRLHGLLARAAPTAVIFRRGPSTQFCTVGWDRRDDSFQLGQWLKRRIYDRRTDLSPDGKHLLYFARSGRNLKAGGSYTALSRAPWLKAIGLWVQDSSYFGGGLFIDDRRMHLRIGADAEAKKVPIDLRVEAGFPYPGFMGYAECPGIYYTRLVRDGWRHVRVAPEGVVDSEAERFERELPHGWVLRKIARGSLVRKQGQGVYFEEHQLLHPKWGTLDFPAWDWADWDPVQKRLVYTTAGALYGCVVKADGPSAPKTLFDFNGMQFTAREAPY